MGTFEEQVKLIIGASSFLFLLLIIIISLVVVYQRKQSSLVKEKEKEKARFQQQLLQSKIEIQEQAFNEISRELHDNIGQQLSLAKLNLNTLKTINDPRDQGKIGATKELIGDTIYQIRSISKTLLGEKVSSIGIAEAIKNETERLEKTGLYTVTFSNESPALQLNPQKEIILFRIVQEALNNITRHADATQINMLLTLHQNILKIDIQDNGKGFNLEQAGVNGIGLLNMRTRAQTIGARLQISSAQHKGTLIEITLLNQ